MNSFKTGLAHVEILRTDDSIPRRLRGKLARCDRESRGDGLRRQADALGQFCSSLDVHYKRHIGLVERGRERDARRSPGIRG